MRPSASVVVAALRAGGVTIQATSRSALLATPKASVTPEIAALIVAYKPEFLSALFGIKNGSVSRTISACVSCDREFATAVNGRCKWCDVTAATAQQHSNRHVA